MSIQVNSYQKVFVFRIQVREDDHITNTITIKPMGQLVFHESDNKTSIKREQLNIQEHKNPVKIVAWP